MGSLFNRAALADAKRRAITGILRLLPNEMSLQVQYLRAHHRFANLRHPRRFTEKLQVLKLRGGLERHSDWVDKVLAKERVAGLLGDDWIVPTLWHGAALPPRAERTWPTPYLIKANHASGWNIHVDSDADKDWPAIERTCAQWLLQRWHPHLLERQYAGIAPQLLVEPRIGDSAASPPDYKFWVFAGRVENVTITVERSIGRKVAAFDRDWTRRSVTHAGLPQPTSDVPQPQHFLAMRDAAEALGQNFAYARIDFYDLPEGPKFGEVTLTPSSGFDRLEPEAYDLMLGALFDLDAAYRGAEVGYG